MAGQRAVGAIRFADSAGGEHDVDRAEHVLYAVAVMLHAAGMQQVAGRRFAPPLSRLTDRSFGDARDLCRPRRRPRADMFGDLLKTDGMLFDELVIEPVMLDHQVQDAVE